jgi:hypothetical protein
LKPALRGSIILAAFAATPEIPRSTPVNKKQNRFFQLPFSRTDAARPKFGMFGSINTQAACAAERGDFHPYLFTWMIHIFPYELDFKDIFSMNDDVPHVH